MDWECRLHSVVMKPLGFACFDLVIVLQVHISHIGEIKFKGVQDPQSVVQFCTAQKAATLISSM